jgi:GTP-binding protein LepA
MHSKIRNFCIIAHIDHGKSTLADRFLEITGILAPESGAQQYLDSMDIERERGITIKSHPVTLQYEYGGEAYTLNLIDTPGHVDFTYEVSRSLAACEGALLLVDASQGIEAQTLSNYYMAMEHDLTVIPVVNKIDLPQADVESVISQIINDLGFERKEIVLASAKNGSGVRDVLDRVVEKIPAPAENDDKPLRCLVFDSQFDSYRGVIVFVRVFEGKLKPEDRILLMSSGMEYKVEETGIFRPRMTKNKMLVSGEVGYIIAGIKEIRQTRVGDTITHTVGGAKEPLPGYREVKPMVFSSIYPSFADDFEALTGAMEKLRLNDSSLVYEPDSSQALGFGYRCGFLGLLHLEVVQERLEREFGLSLVVTAPSTKIKVVYKNGTSEIVNNPMLFPDLGVLEYAEEPYVRVTIVTPEEFIGNVMKLAISRFGSQVAMNYIGERRIEVEYEMPLAEVIYDFHDRLKSVSRGYASLDYGYADYRKGELVRLDILVGGKKVDALSQIVRKERSYERAREIVRTLKSEIPRHLFKIAVQASIGGQIVARETIGAVGKNVTAKCYGGDITRKRKLIERQKEGKKRMKRVGSVDIPQAAFMAVLKRE